ncbi:L,D-transpeptidase family protein [Tianweitania sp. Rool2]|uniref:L,D-transpeptidase family protein n=2 Tax=Oryzicola mucosus TaxID=2767425 RepID=A0A8J6PQJ9_9HYPH|nr:L,D-transpeptidase family protein [Oryzicola mucosus]
MQLRRFILIGLCSVFCTASAALAATPAGVVGNAPSTAATSHVIAIAAKSDAAQLKALLRKKSPTAEEQKQIKQLQAKIAADRAASLEKQRQAKLEMMRAAARERAQKERETFFARKAAPAEKPAKVVVQAPVRKVPVAVAAPVQQPQPMPADVMAFASQGNNGELRSEQVTAAAPQRVGLFGGLFGASQPVVRDAMLPQTRALDGVLEQREAQRGKFKVKSEFEPQVVAFTGYRPGQIVVDTSSRFLYLIESSGTARRYAIAVGREGLEFKGRATVGDKQEWPRWFPTADMQKREPSKYGRYKDGMNGGPDNPLGARAIYLYQGKTDTHIRIHGTNQPQTIGTNSSNGCFRMVNDHVMDLYRRVPMGAEVIVL